MMKREILYIIGIIVFIFTHDVFGLYEDQIKKFDWRRQNIGKVTSGKILHSGSIERAIVITEENVLAALSARTGEILWRQIFEKPPRGNIKFFHVLEDFNTVSSGKNNNAFEILTVSGVSPTLVRGWCSETGNLKFEWSLSPLQLEKAEDAFYFYKDFDLYHVIPVWGSHFELTQYHASTGQSSGKTSKITAPWLQDKDHCHFAYPYYSCEKGDELMSIDLALENPKIIKTPLPANRQTSSKPLEGTRHGGILLDGNVIYLNEGTFNCRENGQNIYEYNYQGDTIFTYVHRVENELHVIPMYKKNCEKIHELAFTIPYLKHYDSPSIIHMKCLKAMNYETTCDTLISTADGGVLLVNEKSILWTREEALAKIVATELIDLPLSDSEGAIENELSNKPGNILEAFLRRITGQIHLLRSTILHSLGIRQMSKTSQDDGLERDRFGLHKMLVVLTKSGKLFGIDNLSGSTHWIQLLPDLSDFNNGEKVKLIIQRSSKHFPHPAVCAVVGRNRITGKGIIYRFNPITGNPIDEGYVSLNYRIKQFALLRENENDFTRGVLLLDEENNLHVIPEEAKKMAHNMHIFTASRKTAELEGYHIQYKDNHLIAHLNWNLNLAGRGDKHEIVGIAGKNPTERVHSQGRVLSDRSVLYKYINPNLIAVITQGLDHIHKYIMNVHLIDVVSGSIVYTMTHRKVRPPLHIVHSENWLVYSYYNDKVRRTEITTVELYEGKVQTNSTVWSSLNAPPLPLIEKQSFIIPTTVEAMSETITERGITNKHVLIGTSNGGIVELPWALLDPRRPTDANIAREEGSIPYIPELPLPTENIINYNQSISRITDIYTSPSGLESTCLVVAHGLDLFVTRVSPSKTFDLLKEDFDYFLISVVLVGLIVGSWGTKYLSARKILKQAWK